MRNAVWWAWTVVLVPLAVALAASGDMLLLAVNVFCLHHHMRKRQVAPTFWLGAATGAFVACAAVAAHKQLWGEFVFAAIGLAGFCIPDIKRRWDEIESQRPKERL